MGQRLNRLLDFLSEALAQRKGLLLVIAILLVAINYLLQFIPGAGWLVETNLLLHFGIVLGLIGVMIAWAL
jgi:hypothetical protein